MRVAVITQYQEVRGSRDRDGFVRQAMAYFVGTLMALLVVGVLGGAVVAFLLHRGGVSELAASAASPAEPSAESLQTDYSISEEDACNDEICVTAWEGQETCSQDLSCDFRFTGTKPADVAGPIIDGSSPLAFERYEITGDEIGSESWVAEGDYTCFGAWPSRPFQLRVGSADAGELSWREGVRISWMTECTG